MKQIVKIIEAIPLDNYHMHLTFDDGKEKIVDMKPFIRNGISIELRNPEYFKKVILGDGFISWENGYDFCPEFLYNYIE